MHELRSHPPGTGSAMINLTYDNEHLPPWYNLSMRDYQLFNKKLRKEFGPGLRFFGCGEYGEKNGRPHYHLITFNYRPSDLVVTKRMPDYNYYSSKHLNEMWGLGNVLVGDVSFDSCAYVARYCLKKISGPKSDDNYAVRTSDAATAIRRKEFVTMSRKPGLGFKYYQTYRDEILAHDNIIMNGHEVSVPRYYDKLTENSDFAVRRGVEKSTLEQIKSKRVRKTLAFRNPAEHTSRRLRTKELVRQAKLKQKERKL